MRISATPPRRRKAATACSVEALFAPDLTVWTACEGDVLLGMGALKALSSQHGEIKSMHTATAARGKGIAKKMLLTILASAQERGYRALWLETGVHPILPPHARYMKRMGL